MTTNNFRAYMLNDSEETVFIVSESVFEEIYLKDAYNRSGNRVGSTDAGDYAIANHDNRDCREEFYRALITEYSELEDVELSVEGDDSDEYEIIFDYIKDEERFRDKLKIYNEFVKKWAKENEVLNKVFAWNYFDNFNMHTLYLDCEDLGHSCIPLADEKNNKMLEELKSVTNFEYPKYIKEVKEIIESKNYRFTFDLSRSTPYFCTVKEL